MALGIGLNTMVFTMVYGVLYRPMPLPHSEQLVRLEHWEPKRNNDQNLSFTELRMLRDKMKTIDRVGGWWDHNAFVTIDRDPERFDAATVSYDLFDVLGVKPELGHGFTAADEVWGQNWIPVAISD